MPLTDPGQCQTCARVFDAGDRLRSVFTAPRFGVVPRAMLLEITRFSHVFCNDTKLTGVIMAPPDVPLEPRCKGDTCVRCRKLFAPGDRFDVIYIVVSTGISGGQRGVHVNAEFELAHVACEDPQLSGRLIGRIDA